jgi:hypothetical protein
MPGAKSHYVRRTAWLRAAVLGAVFLAALGAWAGGAPMVKPALRVSF